MVPLPQHQRRDPHPKDPHQEHMTTVRKVPAKPIHKARYEVLESVGQTLQSYLPQKKQLLHVQDYLSFGPASEHVSEKRCGKDGLE